MSFLRAYEDGRPASTPNHLRWRTEGAEAEEPVFAAAAAGQPISHSLLELHQGHGVSVPFFADKLMIPVRQGGTVGDRGGTTAELRHLTP